jgi:hypothetical protein
MRKHVDLVAKSEEQKPLLKPRRSLKDNIKTDVKKQDFSV